MTFDEALGEAVTGHNVTSPCIPEGSWIEYEIGKGWSKVFPNGDRSGVVFDDIMRAAEWFYWREPTRDGWGKVTYPTYTEADATLKTYDEEPKVYPEFDPGKHLCEDEGCPQHGTPHVCIVSVDRGEKPARPSAPWGKERVDYRGYEVYRVNGFAGYNWEYIHKDYDGPEDNRFGHCRNFAECLDEIDEELDP